jgi:hypothetical protein
LSARRLPIGAVEPKAVGAGRFSGEKLVQDREIAESLPGRKNAAEMHPVQIDQP